MSALFIRDGYTLEDVIPAKGRRPALKFRYRPALPEETYEYLHQSRLAPGKAAARIAAAFLKDHLVGWDIVNDNGQVEAVTLELLRRLAPPVFNALLDIVMGYGENEAEADAKN